MKKLWCDLKSDEERLEFIRNGRAVETGIIAPTMVPELVSVFEELLNQRQEVVPHDTVVSNSIATEYAEFCVRCDRENLPLLFLEDYIKEYC